MTGLSGKKSKGRRTMSCHITGMTGQSSARGTWWKPRRLGHPDAFSRRILERAFDQAHGHEAVVDAVHVEVQAVGQKVIVVHANGVFRDEVPELVGCAGHVVAAVFGGAAGLHGFGFDDAGSSRRDAQAAVACKAPVENVVVVADHRGGAQHQHAGRAAAGLVFFEMPPRQIARVTLEKAGHLGVQHRKTMVVGRQAVDVYGI